jgi:hypothetical protein
MAVGHQLGAVFDDADFFYLRQDAEPTQHRKRLWKERFADMESRV